MKVKKNCPICNYSKLSQGHLCKECFSPLTIIFEKENNNRSIKMPIVKASKKEIINNTPNEAKAFIPIPEVTHNFSQRVEQKAVNPGETAKIINNIEQTLSKILNDSSPVKIQKSEKCANQGLMISEKIAQEDLKKKNPQPKKETGTKKKIDEFKSKLKLKKKLSEEKTIINENEPQNNAEYDIKNKLVNLCNTILELEKPKESQELSNQISDTEKSKNNQTQSQESKQKGNELDEIPIPEIVDDKYWNKWSKIQGTNFSPSTVDAKILKRYKSQNIPKKLAGYEQTIATSLGEKSFYDLPKQWRLEVRKKALDTLGIKISPKRYKLIMHATIIEAKLDELRNQPKKIKIDFIENGNWRWFGLAFVLHLILLIAAFSIILVHKIEEPLKSILTLETEQLVPEIKQTTITEQPDVIIDPEEFPVDDYRDDFEPEFDNPEQEKPVPDIPGEHINLSDIHKVKIDTKDPRPVILNPSAKIGAEGGQGGEEKGTDKPSNLTGLRQGAGKKEMLARHGGNERTENAVKLGLEWLAKQQHKDGFWKTADALAISNVYVEGYTGLALLCFLGAGHTDVFGDYKETVRNAVQYLLRKQTPSGAITSSPRGTMYNHSLATLALTEYYSMTGNEELLVPIKNALNFIYTAQQPSGGWDYTASKLADRTDMSITGWVVMALHSAMTAKIPIKGSVWRDAVTATKYLVTQNGDAFYSIRGDVYPFRRGISMIAVSMLIRLYARENLSNDVLKASFKWVSDNLPMRKKLKGNSKRNQLLQRDLPSDDDFFHTTYYWYYGTLTTFMLTNGEGQTWNRWNRALQNAILSYQLKSGANKGSWDPEEDFWGAYAGRLYSTCMNILNLEIYYRYLPIYRESDAPLLFEENIIGTKQNDARPKPQPEASDLFIKSIDEAVRIINDPTRSESEKLVALTYLSTQSSDEAFVEITNILWRKNAPEMIRWQVILMLEGYADDGRAVEALIEAFKLPFNRYLRTAIIRTLGNMRRKRGLLFIATLLDDEDNNISKAALTTLEDVTKSRFGDDKYAWLNWLHNTTEFK